MREKADNCGYNQLKDSEGRPLQVRAPVRNRLASTGDGERRVMRRTIVNISWVWGGADWLYEDIEVRFRAIGWARFPKCQEFDQVALEVNPDGSDKGWVRVDKDSVEYEEVA